jgi:hypothetical protein
MMSGGDRVVGMAAEAVAEVAVLAVLQLEEGQTLQGPAAAPGNGRIDDPVAALRPQANPGKAVKNHLDRQSTIKVPRKGSLVTINMIWCNLI